MSCNAEDTAGLVRRAAQAAWGSQDSGPATESATAQEEHRNSALWRMQEHAKQHHYAVSLAPGSFVPFPPESSRPADDGSFRTALNPLQLQYTPASDIDFRFSSDEALHYGHGLSSEAGMQGRGLDMLSDQADMALVRQRERIPMLGHPEEIQMRRAGVGESDKVDPERELDPTNLYLANMPLSWTEDDLRVLIGQFGTVISTYVMRDAEGKSRGAGFARMASHDACVRAIKALRFSMSADATLPLQIRLAELPTARRPGDPSLKHQPRAHSAHHYWPGTTPKPSTSAALATRRISAGHYSMHSSYHSEPSLQKQNSTPGGAILSTASSAPSVFTSSSDANAQSEILKRIGKLCSEGYFNSDIKRSLWRAMRREDNVTQAMAANQAYSADDAQFAEWCMSVLLE